MTPPVSRRERETLKISAESSETTAGAANTIHTYALKLWEAASETTGETTAAKTLSIPVNKHRLHMNTTIH
jgi:hypothetical protein